MQKTTAAKSALVRKIALSGLVISIYLTVMYVTAGFAFGQHQIRIATAVYAVAAIHPYLIVPLAAANAMSNFLFGTFFLPDVLGGLLAGLLTTAACYLLRKVHLTLVAFPILLIPSLIVPAFLSPVIGIPYPALVLSIGIGQMLPAVTGVVLVKLLEKTPFMKK